MARMYHGLTTHLFHHFECILSEAVANIAASGNLSSPILFPWGLVGVDPTPQLWDGHMTRVHQMRLFSALTTVTCVWTTVVQPESISNVLLEPLGLRSYSQKCLKK